VVTPFRPALSKEQIEKLRVKKVARVGELRKIMRLQMVDSATALKEVPPEEWIVVGVTLFYYSWEDTAGLPSQILMQAKRQSLLDFEAGRIDSGQLESLTRVEEI
jgi:hypothetical protein